MIVGVPVYYLDTMEYFPVEIQFRTMAMDFWASMEHRICYKKQPEHREELAAAFQQYAKVLENIEEQFEAYNETGRLGDVNEPEIPWWQMLAQEAERDMQTTESEYLEIEGRMCCWFLQNLQWNSKRVLRISKNRAGLALGRHVLSGKKLCASCRL